MLQYYQQFLTYQLQRPKKYCTLLFDMLNSLVVLKKQTMACQMLSMEEKDLLGGGAVTVVGFARKIIDIKTSSSVLENKTYHRMY